MTDLTATLIDRRRNQYTFELFDAITIKVTSSGKDQYQDHHTVTISAVDNETGEYAVIPINGIEYTLYYATGRITEGGTSAHAMNVDVRRTGAGYFGTPPTDKARSAFYALVRDVMEQIRDHDKVDLFLAAGTQVKLRNSIERQEADLLTAVNEYTETIGKLHSNIDVYGDSAGLKADGKLKFNAWGIS
jgi:hypothetical protein